MIAILKKELRASLREKTGWALLVSMPALFLLFGMLNLRVDGGASDSPYSACEAGRTLLAVGVYSQVIALMLILPPLAAVNLVREGERKTLETLMTTPCGATELGLAKLLSPLALAMASVLLTLPLLMALPLLGGVRPWEPLAGTAAALAAALLACGIGLAAGALARATAGSVILAVLASGVLLICTNWPLWRGASTMMDAATPLGMAVAVTGCQRVVAFGFELPVLAPGILLLGLSAACLFFVSLPYLATPYRRQALPVRLLAAAAAAVFTFFVFGSLRGTAAAQRADILSAALVIASLAASFLLILERLDSGGRLTSLPGSAEAAATAAGGWFRRLLASRTGLALLPLAAVAAGSLAMLPWAFAEGPTAGELADAAILAAVYTFFWALFCVAASGLVARRGRCWREAFACQILPAAVFIGDLSMRACGTSGGLFFSPPGALARLDGVVSRAADSSLLSLAVATAAAALLAAVVGALAWATGVASARLRPGNGRRELPPVG